jgi:exosortase E/protease (VPEID-CTERM system)
MLGAMLAIEAISLSVRFDGNSLIHVNSEWAVLLGRASLIGRFAISIAVAVLIFGADGFKEKISRLSVRIDGMPFPWLLLTAHLILLAGFYRLSIIVFEGNIQAFSYPVAWVLVWLGVGVSTLACLAAAAIPVSLWAELGVSGRTSLLFAAAVGVVAVVAGQLADVLWRPLGASTLWIAEHLLRMCYADVTVDDADFVIGAKSFAVQISPQCSGYEGIGLIAVFVVCFLWCFRTRLRFPQAFGLLLLGIGAIWLANGARIAALVAIGASVSQGVALGGFHSQAGWLAFNAVALGVIAAGLNWPLFAKTAARRTTTFVGSGSNYPAAAYLLPFLILIAAGMITRACSNGGLDRLYPVTVIVTGGAVWLFRRTYRKEGLFSWPRAWGPIVIGILVFAIWIALEPRHTLDEVRNASPFAALANWPIAITFAWIAFRCCGSIVAVPLSEELAFRGFLTRRLISEDFEQIPIGSFSWFSFVGSSVLFGLMHSRWLAGTVAGMLFALALCRRGKLMDAVVAHATANSFVTCYALATGNWAVWS